jgi:polysaccharide biosynthesis transport protein
MDGVLQSDASTLRHALEVVRRRKWLVLQMLVIVPLLVVFLSLRQERLYQASADVFLSNRGLASSVSGLPDPNLYVSPDRIAQTRADLARVPKVVREVLAAVPNSGLTTQQFLQDSSVVPKANSDLLVFSVTHRDPALAARLATEYARRFTDYNRRLETTALVRALRGIRRNIASLEAQGRRKSDVYDTLLEREQQLKTMLDLMSTESSLVRAADRGAQVQPRPVRNGVLAGILGLVLGLGLAFLWEALDTRVRTVEAVGSTLRLPLLARLPKPRRKLRNTLVMLKEPHGSDGEPYRILRTNVDFVNLERGARTIMVTSALGQEGKTSTISNLAVALVRAGKNVVLVDLDLRRPSLGRAFGISRRAGLTDVALGQAHLAEALAPVSIDSSGDRARETVTSDEPTVGASHNGHGRVHGSLRVLTSGPTPPDPGEFISTKAVAEILASLRAQSDVVLIDAAPLLHVGDAMSLSARVDGMLVVVRLENLRRSTLTELDRVLQRCPATKLGFVATGVERDEDYGYGDYYRSPSTSEKEEQKERTSV